METAAPNFAKDLDGIARLRTIGNQLDDDIFPGITWGGFVEPAGVFTPIEAAGNEVVSNEHRRQARSKTRPGQGPAGRKGQARSSPGTPGPAAPVLGRCYEKTVEGLKRLFPEAEAIPVADGYWLFVTAGLVEGIARTVEFVSAVRVEPQYQIETWGFWGPGIWIGPRHTNVPSGSICAYEIPDGTWRPGNSLFDLFALYTCWATRHLHLELFGRWPGRQVIHTAHERVREQVPDEWCGCPKSASLYRFCHMEDDHNRHPLYRELTGALFWIRNESPCGLTRQVPSEVLRLQATRKRAPLISSIIL